MYITLSTFLLRNPSNPIPSIENESYDPRIDPRCEHSICNNLCGIILEYVYAREIL